MGTWKSLKTDGGTGWKSIYRVAGTGWKALDWDSVPIDVGDACIDRGGNFPGTYTLINLGNPANVNGTLTNVCIYMNAVTANSCHVGIFYLLSGATYKCRSTVNVGALSVGINNKAVSLTITTGDVIGFFGDQSSNKLERETSGGDGILYHSGNSCVVDNETTYITTLSAHVLSLYGTG